MICFYIFHSFSDPHSAQATNSIWLQDVLRHPPPYPMIALPPNGGYWLEDANFKRPDMRHWINKDECDKTAKEYRTHYKGLEHQNYYGLDSTENPIVVSVKLDANGCYDLIIRNNEGSQIACVRESPASGLKKKSSRFFSNFPSKRQILSQFHLA